MRQCPNTRRALDYTKALKAKADARRYRFPSLVCGAHVDRRTSFRGHVWKKREEVCLPDSYSAAFFAREGNEGCAEEEKQSENEIYCPAFPRGSLGKLPTLALRIRASLDVLRRREPLDG